MLPRSIAGRKPHIVSIESSVQVDLYFTQEALGAIIQFLVNLSNYMIVWLTSVRFVYKDAVRDLSDTF